MHAYIHVYMRTYIHACLHAHMYIHNAYYFFACINAYNVQTQIHEINHHLC